MCTLHVISESSTPATMSFPYKCVLMIGATSGNSAAIAARMAKEGKKVLVLGRRKDRLGKFVREHGFEKATAYVTHLQDR